MRRSYNIDIECGLSLQRAVERMNSKTLEEFVLKQFFTLYPIHNSVFHLSKVIFISAVDLLKIKKNIQNEEALGSTYIFWCFISFEDRDSLFYFGQITIYEKKILFACKNAQYSDFAKIAYKRSWFEEEDVRERII